MVPEVFLPHNLYFVKSALTRYIADHFFALVKRHDIAFHEKKLGQRFRDNSLQDIIVRLQQVCEWADRHLWQDCAGKNVGMKGNRYEIETADYLVTATSLVLATGGL